MVMKLTVEDFIKLRNLIYEKAGMSFEPKKIYFVKKRVEKRMEILGLEDVSQYYNLLKFKDKFGTEMQELLNLMTTNETYFFRELNQLEVFRDFCLKETLERKRKKGGSKIKIWCAGCSTGEEPYTVAIMLRESLRDYSNWDIEILANDIDTGVLKRASEGVYRERAVRFVPPPVLKKYFTVTPHGNYNLSGKIKDMVRFVHMNLIDNSKMRAIRGMDFIFCRNVLIYFDDVSRKTVMANFYDSLSPYGYIYLGHSESITRISTTFNIKRAMGLIVHQKPGLPGKEK